MEEELAKRVQQLLFERKDEIEAEVLRRVEEAKKVGLVDGDGRSLWDTNVCVVQCPPISTLEGFVCVLNVK